MKIKFICMLALLILSSCSNNNNDDEVGTEQVKEIQGKSISKLSWTFPILSEPIGGNDPNYYFEYNSDGKLVKKIGGTLLPAGSTGVPPIITDKIYTSVVYNGNTATTANYSSDSSINPQLNERLFEFDNHSRVIKAVIYFPYNPEWEKHQIYNYDGSGKLVSIETQLPNMPYIPTDPNDYILTYMEKFTYDNTGNLLKATTTERRNNIDVFIKKELVFSNYDTADNPFMSLRILEDYFYFSLSKNNAQKMVITQRNENSNQYSTNEKTWTNQYDAEGNLKVSF